eukprot:6051662-Lingulodinium_polyedra.AAC.1
MCIRDSIRGFSRGLPGRLVGSSERVGFFGGSCGRTVCSCAQTQVAHVVRDREPCRVNGPAVANIMQELNKG